MDDYGDEMTRLRSWAREVWDKMNMCTKVRALRSCSGVVHVARVVGFTCCSCCSWYHAWFSLLM